MSWKKVLKERVKRSVHKSFSVENKWLYIDRAHKHLKNLFYTDNTIFWF